MKREPCARELRQVEPMAVTLQYARNASSDVAGARAARESRAVGLPPQKMLTTSGRCGTYITSALECESAAAALGLADVTANSYSSPALYPPGCIVNRGNLEFNTDGSSSGS